MDTRERSDATGDPKKDHPAIQLPERMDRPEASAANNKPGTTVGTETPGKKKGQREMSEAAERKARREGTTAPKKE